MVLEHLRKRIYMQTVVLEGVQVPAERPLGLERHEFAAQESLLAVVFQIVVQSLLGNLVEVRVQVIHVAVVVQQLDGGLRAHLGHARHVVARISHEREVVANFFRREPVFFQNLFGSEVDAVGAFGQVEKVNLVAHDLRHVLVFAENHHVVETRLDGRRRGTRHHVVRFVTRFREQRNSARFEAFAQQRHLRRHLFGHGAAIRLVVRVKFVPESLRVRHVARNRKVRRVVLCQDAEHRTPVTVHHRDVFALAVLERVLRIRVEHAERKRVGIKQ